MIFVGNLKSAQLRTLCIMLQYSLMQNLRIFGSTEGICFEFTNLNWFWKIWKRIKSRGPACHPHCLNSGTQTMRPVLDHHCHYRFLPAGSTLMLADAHHLTRL
jgi:hypothetical protein